jgi:phospholipid transport system substrate-binding protein
MRRAATLLLAGLLLAGLAPAARGAAQAGAAPAEPAPDAAAARAPVERLYAALADVLQRADALGFDGRYRTLEPVVSSSYDVPFMAQLILGSEWRRLAPERQARWVETFTRFTVSTYADRFDHPGLRFEIGAVEPAAQGTSLVRTTLLPEDDEPVKLDYRVRPSSESWRIVDVYLSGTVSELALRRSEYSALIKREGFDALLAAMEQKIAAAKAGTAEEAGAP